MYPVFVYAGFSTVKHIKSSEGFGAKETLKSAAILDVGVLTLIISPQTSCF